jgi:hypothetical protein
MRHRLRRVDFPRLPPAPSPPLYPQYRTQFTPTTLHCPQSAPPAPPLFLCVIGGWRWELFLVGHNWARGAAARFHFGWLTVTRSVATHCPPKNPHFCPDVYHHMYTSETKRTNVPTKRFRARENSRRVGTLDPNPPTATSSHRHPHHRTTAPPHHRTTAPHKTCYLCLRQLITT